MSRHPLRDDIPIESITLEWLRAHLDFALPADARLEQVRDHILRHIRYSLRYHLLAERLGPAKITTSKTFHFAVPASPWQQFKADHADAWWLRWLVKRRPVVQATHEFVGELEVDVQRFWTFPESKVQSSDFGQPIRLMQTTPIAFWREMENPDA